MLLGRNLQQRRKSLIIRIHFPADLVGDVLVDEHDGDVFALAGEGLEGVFDGARGGFGVDHQVVFLAVGRVGDVADACEEDACY